MVDFYQIRSPLSQITEERMHRFVNALSDALGEKLEKVSLEQYLADDFALLYVASGGSEGFFLEVFEQLKGRHCYILTSGESNSLAASMEILSFLNKHGGSGEILHGDIEDVAGKIRALALAHRARAKLRGKKLGCIGAPSDWLIASNFSEKALMDKLGLGFVSIPIEELIAEIGKESYERDEYADLFLAQDFDKAEIEKALYVYGAFQRLIDKYGLCGLTVRCFDLLDTVHTTGCLGLAILNARGIWGGCEGDMPALISMAVLGAITDEPLFLCNPSRFDRLHAQHAFRVRHRRGRSGPLRRGRLHDLQVRGRPQPLPRAGGPHRRRAVERHALPHADQGRARRLQLFPDQADQQPPHHLPRSACRGGGGLLPSARELRENIISDTGGGLFWQNSMWT